MCRLNSDSYLYQKASKAFEKGNYQKAEEIFARIADYKDSEERYGAAGYFYAKECAEQSDYEKALELLREHEQYAVTVDAEDIKALKDQLAEGLRGQEKYEEAAGLYQEIGDTWAAAECYAEMGNYLQALDLTQDLSLQSEQAAARRGWYRAQSILYAKEKKYDEALEIMKDDSAEYEDEWGQAVYETAEFLVNGERYEDAMLLLEKIKNDKEEAVTLLTKCYENLAIIYAQSGNYENAVKYYDLSGKKETVRPYLYDMAKACMNEGSGESYDKAISIWENELKDYQDSEAQLMECCRQRGILYEQSYRYELAMEMYEKCGDETLMQECRYNWAVYCAGEGHDYEKAIELFTELGDYEDSAEKILECRYSMASQFSRQSDYQQAAELFRELGDYKDSVEQAQLCEERERKSLLFGTWETSSGDIKMSFSMSEITFALPAYLPNGKTDWRYYKLKCGLEETFGHRVVEVPGYIHRDTWSNWDYNNGVLSTLYNGSYTCTVDGNTMTLVIEGKTFILTKKSK